MVRMDAVRAEAEQAENVRWAIGPARPAERRIAPGIGLVHARAPGQQQLDRSPCSKGGGAMQRRFAIGSAIAHEAARLGAIDRHAIGIGAPSEQHPDDLFMLQALEPVERGMKRHFARIFQRPIGIGALSSRNSQSRQ